MGSVIVGIIVVAIIAAIVLSMRSDAKGNKYLSAVPAAAVRMRAAATAAHKNTNRNPQNNETSP